MNLPNVPCWTDLDIRAQKRKNTILRGKLALFLPAIAATGMIGH